MKAYYHFVGVSNDNTDEAKFWLLRKVRVKVPRFEWDQLKKSGYVVLKDTPLMDGITEIEGIMVADDEVQAVRTVQAWSTGNGER